ncbi:tetratricopeptide repeat protein [Micromonospora sp. NPDC000089]|uniref:tetratricopeptide repeat protein n=1 Tax=unclassified Micromonospora TaxID=2617518 RepID=UPI003682701C
MSSDADRSAADGYLDRAQLLAELGRYDEAVEELGFGLALEPGTERPLTLLARVHLAAGRPREALAAADAALAVTPDAMTALVLRGLALADLREFAEAARTAERILGGAPGDAYAQRAGAAILADARNGQPALDAAWRGVELAPDEPQGHLVLALVAGRLDLYDLAERAYREALRLDPEVGRAATDPGVLRLERRRWAEALEQVAALAPVLPERPDRPTVPDGLRRLVFRGGLWTLVGSLLSAVLAGSGTSQPFAAAAAVGTAVYVWWLARRVPGLLRVVLPVLRRDDRPLAVAVYAVVAGPVLLLLHALVGTPWPLAAAVAGTVGAVFVTLRRLGV